MAFKFSANKPDQNNDTASQSDAISVSGDGFTVTTASDNISGTTEWRINENAVSLIVHTAGKIESIETEFNGKSFRLDPPAIGEIWLVPVETKYSTLVKGETVKYLEIILNPDLLAETSNDGSKLVELKPVAGVFDKTLIKHFGDLLSLQNRQDDVAKLQRSQIIENIAWQISDRFAFNKINPTRRDINFSEHEAAMIQEFIFDNLSEQLSLERLCKLVGETPHRFLWAFNNFLGKSPAQYIIETRLRRTRKLLMETGKNITEIAMETGFSDHSHLSTVFKKHTGYTPSEFRSFK